MLILEVAEKHPMAGKTTERNQKSEQIDLGTLVKEAQGSWDVLRKLAQEISDEKRMQYLAHHYMYKPTESDILHSHKVAKNNKT